MPHSSPRSSPAKGIELLHVVQVGDDLDRLTGTLAAAIDEADLVICTGGIGPTDDDLTREAIAAVAGETPRVDEALVAEIREFFAQRGLEMPERNAKQAWVIPSAEVLPNPVGTAPGWLARVDDTMIVAMPGVPREMVRMWREQALPRISAHLTGRVYRSANLRTLGIGESAVSQLLDELTRRPEPYIGTYAKDDGVHVRVTASGDDPGQAERDLTETVAEVRRRLGEHVYADDDRSLAHVLLDALRERGLTIGIAESGTGGRFGSTLLSEPSATGVVRGVVAEASDSIAATAGDLARSARERFSADDRRRYRRHGRTQQPGVVRRDGRRRGLRVTRDRGVVPYSGGLSGDTAARRAERGRRAAPGGRRKLAALG